MFLVMGASLLISVLVMTPRIARRLHSLRDKYWVLLAFVVLVLFSVGLLTEGVERMGWTR